MSTDRPFPGPRIPSRGRPAHALEAAAPVTAIPTPTRTRISDVVYEELREAIRSLRLPPGAPLSEPAVAAWLEVSRAPVREAFTRLADQKLITIVPQVGSRVAAISMSGVQDAVFIRNALEKSAFEQAIALEHLDTTELQALVDRNGAAALRGDAEDFFASDEQLHQLIFALAGVPRMWQIVRSTKVQLDRLRQLNLGAAMANAEVLAEHQGIVDALDAQDAVAGAQIIHKHSHRVLTDTTKLREEYPDFFLT
ncbi:GntR family transcriptional regulator [Microbacterium deminutum]|uniref:GntR family transcriptional regulator n=1 Tax=Microbacterium deminutum TaxID=344164 RepID=A0ABN2R5G2_9MICO